jgi:hypothetical protein
VSRRRWFLVNYGILFAITFVAIWIAWLSMPDPDAGVGDWIISPLLLAVAGLVVTLVLTAPTFTLYLLALRWSRRRWPGRRAAWIVAPLLFLTSMWLYGDNEWQVQLVATLCVPVAATLVRV